MKFGRKIFLSRAPYNGPGTFAGRPGDVPDIFLGNISHEFPILVINIFGTLFVGRMKIGEICFARKLYNTSGTFMGHSRDPLDSFH